MTRQTWLLAALLGSVAITACGGSRQAISTAPQPAPKIHGDSAAIANARPDSNRFPFTEADVHFMTGMIHHHAQALRMTALVPKRSGSRDVELLAKRIDLSQEAEIEQMRNWLRERDEPAPELHRPHGHAHGSGQVLMPGMLTEKELRRLSAATGARFDRLFLEFMVRHHRGAITMVEKLYGKGGGVESSVDAFARHVDSDQQIEITRMEQMLAERP